MWKQVLQFTTRWVARPFGGVFIGQTAIHSAHLFGVYPEKQVAGWFVDMSANSSPNFISAIQWGLAALFALLAVGVHEIWKRRSKLGAGLFTDKFPEADFDKWRQIDPLTIWQAGYLWVGVRPKYPVPFDSPAYAKFSMLLRAAQHGELSLKLRNTYDFAFSQISRNELARYAIQKGNVPEFLSDIVLDDKF